MDFRQLALSVIEIEAQAVFALTQHINQQFNQACELILQCPGRVIVTGMGKSGHIAKKIAATFASTGTPAFYMHPAEAGHGDLGMVTRQDVVVVLSNSGETPELLVLLPLLKRLEVPLIALTGKADSTLAQFATVNLNVAVEKEACPLGLAPTTSTTVALVMGDALAIALLETRGFGVEDFARAHPGGALGRRLLLKIDDLWHSHADLPCVQTHTLIHDVLSEMSEKHLGIVCVVDENGFLVGVYTDGDLRRTLNKALDIYLTPVSQVMTVNCHTVRPGLLAAEALTIMQRHSITALVVVDDANQPIAVVHMHALLQAGIY